MARRSCMVSKRHMPIWVMSSRRSRSTVKIPHLCTNFWSIVNQAGSAVISNGISQNFWLTKMDSQFDDSPQPHYPKKSPSISMACWMTSKRHQHQLNGLTYAVDNFLKFYRLNLNKCISRLKAVKAFHEIDFKTDSNKRDAFLVTSMPMFIQKKKNVYIFWKIKLLNETKECAKSRSDFWKSKILFKLAQASISSQHRSLQRQDRLSTDWFLTFVFCYWMNLQFTTTTNRMIVIATQEQVERKRHDVRWASWRMCWSGIKRKTKYWICAQSAMILMAANCGACKGFPAIW